MLLNIYYIFSTLGLGTTVRYVCLLGFFLHLEFLMFFIVLDFLHNTGFQRLFTTIWLFFIATVHTFVILLSIWITPYLYFLIFISSIQWLFHSPYPNVNMFIYIPVLNKLGDMLFKLLTAWLRFSIAMLRT